MSVLINSPMETSQVQLRIDLCAIIKIALGHGKSNFQFDLGWTHYERHWLEGLWDLQGDLWIASYWKSEFGLTNHSKDRLQPECQINIFRSLDWWNWSFHVNRQSDLMWSTFDDGQLPKWELNRSYGLVNCEHSTLAPCKQKCWKSTMLCFQTVILKIT